MTATTVPQNGQSREKRLTISGRKCFYASIYVFTYSRPKSQSKKPMTVSELPQKKTVHGKKTSRGTELSQPQTPVIQILRCDGRKASQIFA